MDNSKLRIIQTHATETGPWYRVEWLDGTVLIPASRDPEHDAARALQSLGKKGTFETYFGNRPYPSFLPRDISATALWTTTDERRRGLSRSKWRPYPPNHA